MGCRTADFLLNRILRSPETPPFIGLASLKPDRRKVAFEKTRAYLKGSPSRIPRLFREYPYVSAWCLTQALNESYGGAGDQAIYKHIEEVLGVTLDSPNTRTSLYEGFCLVCDKLGLPTRGYDRMVDVYLLHSGVPVAQLPVLIQAFLRQEASFGPPPTESTAKLNRWEDDSLDFLPTTVRTPRRAILWDETAWHAALFARIRENLHSFVPQHSFEERFLEVLSNQQTAHSRAAATGAEWAGIASPKPRLIWRGDGLALRLPRVEGRIQLWQEDDAQPLRLRGDEDWMLPQPWPNRLRWRIGDQLGELDLLPTPSGFTIFDRATGYLVKEVEHAPSELEIDTTDAALLSRSPFSLDGMPALEAGGSGFVGFTRLGFRAVEVSTDVGVTHLRARPRRRLTLHNGLIANGARGPLHGPSALISVETGLERTETRQLRVVIGPAFADVEVSVVNGFGETNIEELLAPMPLNIGSDPLHVRFDLLAPSDGNMPARSSGVSLEAWVWPGFRGGNGFVFDSDPGPQNLVLDQSRHVARDGRGRLSLDPSGGYIVARAVFEIEGALIPFDLPWPDVVVIRRRSDGSTIGLPLGTRLTVGEDNRFETISIRSPDSRASLIVRGRTEERPFVHGLSRNLALLDLLSPATDNKVVLRRGNGAEVVLFELVPSMAPLSVRFLPTQDGLRLRLRLTSPIDAIAIELECEQGGSDFAEVGFGRRPVATRCPPWLSASLPDGDPQEVEVVVRALHFTDGVALARLLVRPETESENLSTWRPLRNARGDTFAIALVSPALTVPQEDLQRRFETLSRWLADCYAIDCWAEIEKVLIPRWRVVGESLADRPGGRGALMLAATLPPPDHTATSWLPVTHPIQILPDLYGAPTSDFASLSASPDSGVAQMAKVFSLNRKRLRDQDQLHVTVYLAFHNSIEAVQTDKPFSGFEPHTLFSNLPKVDSDPSAGWFWRGTQVLGPDHWRASHLRFLERLESAGMFTSEHAETGPNSRREEALHRLIQAVWEMTPEENRPPVPLRSPDREEPDTIDLWAALTLSCFARASRIGGIDIFIDALRRQLNWKTSDVLTTLALLLRLAPELFAFFLLTWQIAKDRP
jgi:hypothetical protein